MAYVERTKTHHTSRHFSIFEMLRQMHGLARQRRVLATLEPHRLKDIGVSGYDAKIEANRPFWDAPTNLR